MYRFFIPIVVFLFLPSLFAETLAPIGVRQFFVEPDVPSTFRFRMDVDPAEINLALVDAEGATVALPDTRIHVDRAKGELAVTLSLPRGFWEIRCMGRHFGIVSQTPFVGPRDSFFAIDGALSWLVSDDSLREDLVVLARRSGIGMIRERVNWKAIEAEKGRFDWETSNRYEKLRNLCRENDIEVLELFHDAPDWTGKTEKYPGDLIATAVSWQTIASRWSPAWGALEIWNEPEISFGAELPADQYVPIVQAISYQYRVSGTKTPVFGGVMAHFHEHWLDIAAKNRLLDVVDGFSFHSYDRTPGLEKLIARYRDWLAKHDRAGMPLWLTECGRPWKRGTERPTAEQDMESAVDIAMKGVESKACGVDQYFPFVYPYYDENDNNFGMTDKQGTPCRSLAAYVQSIRVLSGASYLGDLEIDRPDVSRARVFETASGETIAVLYIDTVKEPKPLKLPGKILEVESATGSPISLTEDGLLPIRSTRLYYVRFEKDSVSSSILKHTEAVRIRRAAKESRGRTNRKSCPLVLRLQYDKTLMTASPDGYFASKAEEGTLPLTVRIFNLGDSERKGRVAPIGTPEPPGIASVTVPPRSHADAAFRLPVDALGLEAGRPVEVRLKWTDEGQGGPAPPELVFSLRGRATWQGVLSSVKESVRLPVDELARWHKNIAGIGTMKMTVLVENEPDVAWRMTARFGEGDRWTYPRFELPKEIDLSRYSGLIIRARSVGKARTGVFLFENGGSGYIVQPAFPDDGQWHVVRLPFDRFGYVGATAPDPNNKLDLDQVRFLSLGANSGETDCVLELDGIAVYVE